MREDMERDPTVTGFISELVSGVLTGAAAGTAFGAAIGNALLAPAVGAVVCAIVGGACYGYLKKVLYDREFGVSNDKRDTRT